MTIYCVSHKAIEAPPSDYFQVLQVGSLPASFAAIRDNMGENIAHKNTTFSELTALYYLWKNKKTDIVGITHYRRFLIPPILKNTFRISCEKPNSDAPTEGDGQGNYASGYTIDRQDLYNLLSKESDESIESSFRSLLETSSIVMPHSNPLPRGDMLYQYTTSHPAYSIFSLLQLLSERDHYLGKAAYEYFSSAGHAHWNNLFITTWDVFDSYCEFLFDILFELEERLILPVCPYQRRVFAFLSERLLNFWIWYNSLTIAECSWCVINETTQEKHNSDPYSQEIYNADWRLRKTLIK